jgi:hypothetical protein
MLAKYIFSHYAIRFLQTTRSPSWTVAFEEEEGGALSSIPDLYFPPV